MRYLGVAENIAELAVLVAEGEEFEQMVGSFIDHNKYLVKKGRQQEAALNFQFPPPLLADKVKQGDVDDCFLAAMTEKLFQDWSLGEPPMWVTEPCRFLNRPHFTIQTRRTEYLEKLKQISPEPFRKRNLFYTEKVLDRC
jgi:hypothetical protein